MDFRDLPMTLRIHFVWGLGKTLHPIQLRGEERVGFLEEEKFYYETV